MAGGDGLDWYVRRTLEFLNSTERLTLRVAVDSLCGTLIWRHNVRKVSRAVAAEIVSKMKLIDSMQLNRTFAVYSIRAYLGDESIVEEMQNLALDIRGEDYQWCQLLGRLPSSESHRLLVSFLADERLRVRLEAALSLAMRGDSIAEEALISQFVPIWNQISVDVRVAVALARLDNPMGIAFVFSNYGELAASPDRRLAHFINSLCRIVDEFEIDADCGSDHWFQEYLATLATRVNKQVAASYALPPYR